VRAETEFHLVETWLPVVGYEGRYEVSDLGRVYAHDREQVTPSGGVYVRPGLIMSTAARSAGYPTVTLCKNGVTRNHTVHVLVLTAFVGPCPDGMEGCHGNDIKTDNRLCNLRWDTQSANADDSVRNGTHNMASKTHCPSGHPYDAENTRITPAGHRICRACHRDSERGRRVPKPKVIKTHCKHGHPLSGDNLYIVPSTGKRQCRQCYRDRKQAAKRLAAASQ